jgi:hypothetical protein
MNLRRKFMVRRRAAAYLLENYGFGAERSLAKYASVGGGPVFRKAGRLAVYTQADLDAWALGKIGTPRLRSRDEEVSE